MSPTPGGAPEPEQPLSRVLEAALAEAGSHPLRFGDLIVRTADRGFGLLMMLLGLPMLIPVLPPGSSTIVGSVYAVFAVQMLAGAHRPWVPRRLRDRVLSRHAVQILRARGLPLIRAVATVPDRLLDAAAVAGLCTGVGDAMLRVGTLKIFADGTLGSQAASMLEPFDGQPGNAGIRVRIPEEIDDLVRRANQAGLWCAIHAVGDRANRDVLDVLERHQEASQRAGARHRIEHVQVLHPDDLPRLARLGVVASMQPIHAPADRDIADRYWGARARWSYAWRSLAEGSAVLAFGSDAPVETPDPWRGLYTAVTRKREEESDGRAWYPEECLSLHEVLLAYTTGAAFAAGTEAWQGTLEPGLVADFIVLDRDPYAGSPEDLLHVQVLATVVDGRVRPAAGPLAGLERRAYE